MVISSIGAISILTVPETIFLWAASVIKKLDPEQGH